MYDGPPGPSPLVLVAAGEPMDLEVRHTPLVADKQKMGAKIEKAFLLIANLPSASRPPPTP